MKTAILVSFLLTIVITTVSVDGFIDQTRVIGNIRAGDRLLDRAWALKTPKRAQNVVYNHQYPKWGWGSTISCIKVLDKWYNGTNGDLYLNSGGVGARSVSLTIQSKLGYGLQYDIEIWGR